MKTLHHNLQGIRAERLVLMAGIVLLISSVAFPVAAVDDAGYRSVFARGAGGRPLALGGAYVAVDGDLSSVIWNPAGLAGVQRKGVYATHTDLIGLGFSEQFAVMALPSWRLGTFSLALRRFAVDGIEGRDHSGVITDTNLQDAESEIALGYGRSFGPALRLGMNVKLQQQELAGYSAAGLGVDLGAQVHPLLALGRESRLARGWSLGLQLRNVVEPNLRLLEDDSHDPAGIRLGTALELPVGRNIDALAVVDLEKTKSMDPRLHAGLELELMELLALRLGSLDGMMTAGSGITWRQFQLDYSFENNEIESVHRVGLGIGFGSTTEETHRSELEREERILQERLASAFAKQNEDRVSELVRSVRVALQAEDAPRALDLVATLRVLEPDQGSLDKMESEAYFLLAASQERDDDLMAATLNYGRAVALDKNNQRAAIALDRVRKESSRRNVRSETIRQLFDHSMAELTAGHLIAAHDGFEQVLTQAPNDPEAAAMRDQVRQTLRIRSEAMADRAVNLAESGRLPAAREALAEGQRLDAACPSLVRAQSAIAEGEQRERDAQRARTQNSHTNREVPVATSSLPAAVPSPPTPSYGSLSPERQREISDLYRRGMSEAERNRRDNALRYWEMVWSEAPDYQQVADHLKGEYLARGMEAFAAGDLDRAIQYWEDTQKIDPNDARARGYLARAQEQRTRIREIRSSTE